jgi:hypothetical protein
MRLGVAPRGNQPGLKRQPIHGDIMSLQSHLDALKGRHASLETKIAAEDSRPGPNSLTISKLKLEKLRVKEEIERIKVQ